MSELFIPVLSHFQNGNPWTAGAGRLRYRVLPSPAQDADAEGVLTAEVWEGPWAYEFSTVEEKKSFPLTREGLEALPLWLGEWERTINARPKRSLEEDVARRRDPQPPKKQPEKGG